MVGSNEVPEREVNGRQTDLWDMHVHVQMNTIKIQGGSNMCITYVTSMTAQYAKRNHVKFKGVMATNEQRGSMLNNLSWPQEYKVDICLSKCHMRCDKVLHNSGNRKKRMMLLLTQCLESKPLKGLNPNHVNRGAGTWRKSLHHRSLMRTVNKC